MKTIAAVALWITIAFAVVAMWVQARWPTTVPEVAAFTLCGAWLAGGLTGRIRLRHSAVLLPLAGLLLWASLQLALGVTVYAWRTEVYILYWAANLAIVFTGLQIFADEQLRDGFLDALLIFGFAIAVISPLQSRVPGTKIFWLFEPPHIFWVPFGPFPYTNQYAAFVELLLPVALYRAIAGTRWHTFYVLTVAVFYTSVIAAASRAGSVLCTAEMVLVPLLLVRRRAVSWRQMKSSVVLFAGILVMLFLAAAPAGLFARFEAPDPYQGRREFVESSLWMLKDRPLTGFGLGNWVTAYPAYALFDDGKIANQAHNDWVQWAVEGGLPLLAIMLAMGFWAVPRALASIWGAGVAVVLVHCLVDYPIQRAGVALVFFTMLAAIAQPGQSRPKPRTGVSTFPGVTGCGAG